MRLLDEFEIKNESGEIDSSLVNIEDLMFCNIPDYLDYTGSEDRPIAGEENLVIDGKTYTPDELYNNAESIIDKLLGGNLFDFEIKGGDELFPQNDDPNNSKGTFDPMKGGTGKGIEVITTNTTIPGYYEPGEGTGKSPNPSPNTNNNNKVVHVDHGVDEDDDGGNSGFGKSAIIEFASDTIHWPHEPYELYVSPGESINSDTIIGRCLQDGEMKPIRSIFSEGVVRVDPSDGGFGRCAKTICHNHIIIDGYEFAREKSYDGSDVRNLMDNPLLVHDYQVHQEEALDAFYIVTEIMPYLLYIKLIDSCCKDKLLIVPYVTPKNGKLVAGPNPLLVQNGIDPSDEKAVKEIIEATFRTKEPEAEFSEFINGTYLPRKKKFENDIKELYGGDDYTQSIKDTAGNPKKLIEFGEEIIRLKNEFYDDILDMIYNYEFGNVDILHEDEQSSRIQWKFHPYRLKDFKMDFKFYECIKGEGETKGDQYANGEHKEFDPIEEDYTFSEYFKSIVRQMRGDEEDMMTYSKKLRDILVEFAANHPEEGDARDTVEEERHILAEFLEEINKVYQDNKIEKIDKDEDKVLKEMFDQMPDEAKWPKPTDYEYRDEFFKKWTFPNIDAMFPKKAYDDNLSTIDPMDYDYAPEGIDPVGMDDLPDYEDVDPGDVEERFMSKRSPLPVTQSDPRKNEKPGKNELGELNYWLKYCAIATIITIPFMATGLIVVPPYEEIQLPCIYIPLKVVNISKVGLIIVVGLAIRGVSINMMLIYVNMNKDPNSVLLPLTILLADTKEIYYDKIMEITKMIPVIGSQMLKQFKSNNVALLKENKKYQAEMVGLDALVLPSKTELVKSAKEKFKEDTRQMVVRLEEDAARYQDEWNNLESAYTDFASGFKDLVGKKKNENEQTSEA